MRSKRSTRSNRDPDANGKLTSGKEAKSSSLSTKKNEHLQRKTSSNNTSTPAKQHSKKPNGDSGLSDDTDDDISLALRDTPTGVRMKSFLRDEFFSSQSTDSQLDVRWDHTSPDAYKRLQRVPKKSVKQAREDLSDIVCRLAPAVNGGEEVESLSNTPPLLCSWLQANKATSNNQPFEGQIFRQSHRNKRGVRKKRKANVQKFDAVLNSLHMCLERLDNDDDADEDKSSLKRSSESSTEDEILYINGKDQNSNQILQTTSDAGSMLLPKDAAQALLEEEEDLWSDDELFEDNSFILQATQLPVERVSKFSPSLCGGKRKQISPVLEQPKNKTKRCAVSPKWERQSLEKDYIPPTCTTSSRFSNGSRSSFGKSKPDNPLPNRTRSSGVNNNENCCRQESSGFNGTGSMSGNSGSASQSMNKSPFRKHSSFSNYETKTSTSVASTVKDCKSPWRKTSSFSGRDNQKVTLSSVANSKPVLKEKVHLFKDKEQKNTSKLTSASKSSPVVSPSSKRNNLDTSWSDEILRQLAEPDEIFESQMNAADAKDAKKETPKDAKMDTDLDDFFDSDDDFSINESMMMEVSTQNPTKKCSKTDSAKKSKTYTSLKDELNVKNNHLKSNEVGIAKLSIKSNKTVVKNVSSKLPDSTQNVHISQFPSQKFTFRSTRQKVSVIGGSTVPTKQSNIASQINSATIQHKKTSPKAETRTKKNEDDDISDTQMLMSSQALFEDDSFMKDDALFESQILAMLDEVEHDSTQQTNSSDSLSKELECDKISCSPEEIEKKRLAAMAKRKAKTTR